MNHPRYKRHSLPSEATYPGKSDAEKPYARRLVYKALEALMFGQSESKISRDPRKTVTP